MKETGLGAKFGRVAAAAAVLAGAGIFAAASPAHAGGCGDEFQPSVRGGRAYWVLYCPPDTNDIEMTGWVYDSSADNKCARVTGKFANGSSKVAKACPSGTTTYFKWKAKGSIADGYLTVT